MRYIGNAMSLGMLDASARLDVSLLPHVEQARIWLSEGPYESCVGHADTAMLISHLLGVPIPMRRVSTALVPGDELLVAQYTGPRLPEGEISSLPTGAKLRWYHVLVSEWETEYSPVFARVKR